MLPRPLRQARRDLAHALVGGAEPGPWWAECHQRVLAAARALTWPSRLVDLETQVRQMAGDFGRAPVVVLEGGAEQPSTLPSSRQPAVGL